MMKSTDKYDKKLKEIRHYINYSEMMPWVGEKYSESKIKVLFLGESHYLAKEIVAHHDVEKWYSGKAKCLIPKDKIKGLNTRIVIETYANGTVKRKSRRIFYNMGKALCDSKIFNKKEEDAYSIYQHIAFMNFFQRPAEKTGGSIQVKPKDRDISMETFLEVVEIITPDIIIFASKKAYTHARKSQKSKENEIMNELKAKIVQTPHPASVWWNKSMKKYNNKKGKELLIDFLELYSIKTDD